MNYYISDLHFGHHNILAFDESEGARHFDSIEEHDNFIIDNWNSRVKKGDHVYVLGDISFAKPEETLRLLSRLNGQIHLIMGNHDKKRLNKAIMSRFVTVSDYKEIKDNGRSVILSHYPIFAFNKQFRGAIHLYGHTHNTFQHRLYQDAVARTNEWHKLHDRPLMLCVNVGAMLPYMGYTPRTLDELSEQLPAA